MARPLRIDFAGALYHAMSRGVDRRPIFADEEDFDRRIAWIIRTVRKYGWRLHAYALLPNHDHLFLETTQANLSDSMHYLNGAYAGYFNHRHDRCGHLFQGRFKAHLIETDGHYREISRYIHLNPVRAGLVARPEEWRWSSYAGYVDSSREAPWITYTRVLKEFLGPGRDSRAAYREFVAAGMGRELEAPWSNATGGLLVGSPEFAARMCDLVRDRPSDRGIPQLSILRPRPSLERILEAVTAAALTAGSPPTRFGWGSDDLRLVASFIGRRHYGYGIADVANAVGFAHGSRVTRAVRKIESNLSRYRPLLDQALRGMDPAPRLPTPQPHD